MPVLKKRARKPRPYWLDRLRSRAQKLGAGPAFTANTPYVNTIPVEKQGVFPGDQEIERRIKSLIRWNAPPWWFAPIE